MKKLRLLLPTAMLSLMAGCATYDYTDGRGGGYYRGAPSVQYRYPPGYYGYPGYPGYYGAGSIGLFDYPVYPSYRGGYPGAPYRRIDRRPPPPRGPDYRPPSPPVRPSPRPSPPPANRAPAPRPAAPSAPNKHTPSPWRNLNGLKR